jgi:hypothetical protein
MAMDNRIDHHLRHAGWLEHGKEKASIGDIYAFNSNIPL